MLYYDKILANLVPTESWNRAHTLTEAATLRQKRGKFQNIGGLGFYCITIIPKT